MQDFIIRADDDVARLERLDSEMTQSYQDLCDFLAIDQKNYSLTEFFTDLKTFCSLFSVDLTLSLYYHQFVFLFRHVFKKSEPGVNKQPELLEPRKYRCLNFFESEPLFDENKSRLNKSKSL